MTLNSEQRQEIVRVRLQNADAALADAALLLANGSLRGALNRAYYAMFYAVSALAVAEGRNFRKHTQIIGYFQKEFTKTGRFDRCHGRALQKAFEERSEADSQDFLHVSQEAVTQRVADARDFVDAVETYAHRAK